MDRHTLEDTIQEMQEGNRVYWRLFVDYEDTPCVVEMQWFDEYDYDQKRFINETHYDTEELAEEALLTIKIKSGVPLTTLERLRRASLL